MEGGFFLVEFVPLWHQEAKVGEGKVGHQPVAVASPL